ncbi:MAG: HD domain-containing protein, partial [Candidatus Omnitrophica bacterium]|nr:HD domain-containing protein [Candidatus Omnitrophota bacterium]
GGGPTELAWLEDDAPVHLWSLQHAPVRLLGQVSLTDPPGDSGLEELRVLTRKAIGPVLRAKLGVPDWTLATSGTAVCLGELCGTRDRAATALEIRVVFRAALKNLLERLAEMDLARRREWLGAFAERADTILSGGAIFLTVLEELGIERMITGCKALRTGIVLDYIEHSIRSTPRDHSQRLVQLSRNPALSETIPDIRAHNIVKLARRYGYDQDHCNRVMELADLLFEGLESLYLLGEEDRFYLQAAALLHDIGYYINSTRHHHHSQYLILHSEMEGFHQMEIRAIACLARYHSRELPGAQDSEYMALPEGMRRKVDLMAGILRIADALDFTHQGLVSDVEVETDPERVRLRLSARGSIHLEVQEANLKGNLLAKALGRRLEIEVQGG